MWTKALGGPGKQAESDQDPHMHRVWLNSLVLKLVSLSCLQITPSWVGRAAVLAPQRLREGQNLPNVAQEASGGAGARSRASRRPGQPLLLLTEEQGPTQWSAQSTCISVFSPAPLT